MDRFLAWVRRFIQELRRRRVIRVAVVYGTTGFVVLQLAEILIDPFGLGLWALRLITLVLILGFPLAVGLAWVFNVTEEGLVRAEAEAEGEIGPEGKPLTSNAIIIGLLAVAVGLLLYPRVFSSGEEATGQASPTQTDTTTVAERSIAVLPFEPLSSGQESKTFARGAHDDLLTRLANISDLKVISRTAVQQYRDTDLTTGQIADSLGVRWVMEGGVQVLGDQIQVNAQLIDPRSETHAWASDYRRDLTAEDLFAIQGEITGEIADALKAQLTAGEQSRVTGAPTQNLKAYRLYAEGRRLMLSRQPDSLARAMNRFEAALAQDSTYALAWSGLAEARVHYANYSRESRQAEADSMRAAIPKAEAVARRALELGPKLAEAHASLGVILLYKQAGMENQSNGLIALQHLSRALELKPSYAEAQHWLGALLLQLARPEQALQHLQVAVELSPDNVSARRYLFSSLIANGQYEEALRQARRSSRLFSKEVALVALEGLALAHLKRWSDVRALTREVRSETDEPPVWTLFHTALADVATGDTASARSRIEVLRKRGDNLWAVLVQGALGELGPAFETLDEIERWEPLTVQHIRYYHPDLLSAFRADPRYEALIRDINEYWGLNPDGTIPDSVGVSLPSSPEADA